MKFLRWFLGIILLFIVISAQSEIRRSMQILPPAIPEKEMLTLEGRDYVYYTVQPGDTLGMLERKFRIPSEDSILDLNPGLKRDHLPANQRIKIPLQ